MYLDNTLDNFGYVCAKWHSCTEKNNSSSLEFRMPGKRPGQWLGLTSMLPQLCNYACQVVSWQKKGTAICCAHNLKGAYQLHWWLLILISTTSEGITMEDKRRIEYPDIAFALRPFWHGNSWAFNRFSVSSGISICHINPLKRQRQLVVTLQHI